jgi:hypothetical protein
MTHEEYAKKVTKLFEKYIDTIQSLATIETTEHMKITDEVIVELLKLKQKAGIR